MTGETRRSGEKDTYSADARVVDCPELRRSQRDGELGTPLAVGSPAMQEASVSKTGVPGRRYNDRSSVHAPGSRLWGVGGAAANLENCSLDAPVDGRLAQRETSCHRPRGCSAVQKGKALCLTLSSLTDAPPCFAK